MSYNHAEGPYWNTHFQSNVRIACIKFRQRKGWSASLCLGDRTFSTEDLFPNEKFSLPKLRLKLAETYGVVIPMKDKLALIGVENYEKKYIIT